MKVCFIKNGTIIPGVEVSSRHNCNPNLKIGKTYDLFTHDLRQKIELPDGFKFFWKRVTKLFTLILQSHSVYKSKLPSIRNTVFRDPHQNMYPTQNELFYNLVRQTSPCDSKHLTNFGISESRK